ncbi:hypothetical protein V2G26_000759 [Clonostachys chloroleuca]
MFTYIYMLHILSCECNVMFERWTAIVSFHRAFLNALKMALALIFPIISPTFGIQNLPPPHYMHPSTAETCREMIGVQARNHPVQEPQPKPPLGPRETSQIAAKAHD